MYGHWEHAEDKIVANEAVSRNHVRFALFWLNPLGLLRGG
jgi:hypothetical protein